MYGDAERLDLTLSMLTGDLDLFPVESEKYLVESRPVEVPKLPVKRLRRLIAEVSTRVFESSKISKATRVRECSVADDSLDMSTSINDV